jgi:competence protein ComEC
MRDKRRRWFERFWTAEGRRLPLWAPVMIGLGVQLFFLDPVAGEPWAAVLCAAVVAARLTMSIPSLWAGVAATALACGAAGYGAAALRTQLCAAPVLAAEGEMLVEGRVLALSQSASGLPRVLLAEPELYGVSRENMPRRVRIALRRAPELRPGDWISVMARLGPPGDPVEPGAYDFARAAWFDGIGAVGVSRGPVVVIDGPPPESALARASLAIDRLRADIATALRAGVAGEAGAFAAAIAVGDRSGLPVETLDALRASGLAHLLAISGLHMAIVSGLAFAAVRLAVVMTPGLGLRAPAKKIAAVAALAASAAYLLLSGASTATVRAFVIAAAAFGAILLGRQAVTMRALAAAACAILLLTPEALLEVGFQMSFAATVALVAVYELARDSGWLARRGTDAGVARRCLAASARFMFVAAATSLIAGLATTPFAAAAFNRISAYGLLANVLGTPVMGLAAAPALAASALLAPFGAAGTALWLAGAGIDWIVGVAHRVAALPGAVGLVAAPGPFAMPLLVGGGLWLCLWRSRIRFAGIAALVAGAAMWCAVDRPDAIVSPMAQAVGVLTPAGRAVTSGPAGLFAAETWLRRDGDPADVAVARAREGFLRIGPWRDAATPGGGSIHLYLSADPPSASTLRRRCATTDVIVAPRVSVDPGVGSCLLLDKPRLRALGAVAIDWNGANVRAISAAGRGPWARSGADDR